MLQFPTANHKHHVLRAVDTGALWHNIEVANRPEHLHQVFDTLLTATNLYAHTFVKVLYELNAGIFSTMRVELDEVTAATFGTVCDEFAWHFHIVSQQSTELLNPAASWCIKAAVAINNYALGIEPSLLAEALLKLLTGHAKSVTTTLLPATLEDVFVAMKDQFPTANHEHCVL
ncbi:hypothetical protein LPJ61_000615 [Coemansia biformis]|uniref:Uncharacterized protein n=1 Tax=Coemansia biformis TaxID=1286918 RepID=A0A9W7YHK7_9FUNG|nr:hypothetical protein LPJ61_000615 [Coemansia biformis]